MVFFISLPPKQNDQHKLWDRLGMTHTGATTTFAAYAFFSLLISYHPRLLPVCSEKPGNPASPTIHLSPSRLSQTPRIHRGKEIPPAKVHGGNDDRLARTGYGAAARYPRL
jgi:hypothetical protein